LFATEIIHSSHVGKKEHSLYSFKTKVKFQYYIARPVTNKLKVRGKSLYKKKTQWFEGKYKLMKQVFKEIIGS
jgi:hypothetical protein